MLDAVQARRRSGLQPPPARSPSSFSDSASWWVAGSPARPADRCSGPMCTSPLRKVPVVTTSARQRNLVAVLEPETGDPPLLDEHATGARKQPLDVGLGRQPLAHPRAYTCLSACARGDQTAGPRLRFSSLNWMPVASIACAHQTAKRVDLPDQMPLGRATDCGIARHVGDRVSRQRAEADPIRRAAPQRTPPRIRRGRRRRPQTSNLFGHLTYLPMQNCAKMAPTRRPEFAGRPPRRAPRAAS